MTRSSEIKRKKNYKAKLKYSLYWKEVEQGREGISIKERR